MRIVAWNCQMGLDKKVEALLGLNADIAVIPECSQRSAALLDSRGYQTLWFGANPHKGLAVISRGDWPIRAIQSPEQRWIVPIEVAAKIPFTLIAVWACRVGTKMADNYIGQLYRALNSHPEWFGALPVVVAGDFNSNAIWDHERRMGNHSTVVSSLAEAGLVSVYHEFFKEPHGQETRPTIHLYRHLARPFHLDYIFIPTKWAARLQSVQIGEFERWSKLSDHLPIIVELGELELGQVELGEVELGEIP